MKSTPTSTKTIFPKLPINESSYIMIVTRGHRDDMRVLKWAVGTQRSLHRDDRQQAQSDRRGSRAGKGRHCRAERSSAFLRPWVSISAPITPEEIAVSVVAEMIAVRRNPDADWKRVSKSVYLNERLRAHLT